MAKEDILIKMVADDVVEVVECPETRSFRPVTECEECPDHKVIDDISIDPKSGRMMRRVTCLKPESRSVVPYKEGHKVLNILNCPKFKSIIPVADCGKCDLHGGPVRKERMLIAILCKIPAMRSCGYLLKGLREADDGSTE